MPPHQRKQDEVVLATGAANDVETSEEPQAHGYTGERDEDDGDGSALRGRDARSHCEGKEE